MPAMDINDFANFFKSLSEPVRLRILYLLLERGELCVCDIVSSLELSQSVVSRHLASLRNSGLVDTRREGVWIYYQLAENNGFIGKLLRQFQEAGGDCATFAGDLQRLQAEDSERSCC